MISKRNSKEEGLTNILKSSFLLNIAVRARWWTVRNAVPAIKMQNCNIIPSDTMFTRKSNAFRKIHRSAKEKIPQVVFIHLLPCSLVSKLPLKLGSYLHVRSRANNPKICNWPAMTIWVPSSSQIFSTIYSKWPSPWSNTIHLHVCIFFEITMVHTTLKGSDCPSLSPWYLCTTSELHNFSTW